MTNSPRRTFFTVSPSIVAIPKHCRAQVSLACSSHLIKALLFRAKRLKTRLGECSRILFRSMQSELNSILVGLATEGQFTQMFGT